MIFDDLKNIEFYYGLSSNLSTGLEFLKNSNNLGNLPLGKLDISGNEVFAIVQAYETKAFNRDLWEAHKAYYDIQFLIEGEELVKHSRIEDMEANTPYNEDGDYWLFSGDGNSFKLSTNQFAIFAPEDIHQPGLVINNNPSFVKKIVVKALI